MKKILLSGFLLVVLLITSSLSAFAKTTCKITLMSTKQEKKAQSLLDVNEMNDFFNYTIQYNSTWQKVDYDNDGFFSFRSPKTPDFAGLSINPFTPKNGGGINPKPLKKTEVKIDGKKAIWEQWKLDLPDQNICQEGGKIYFKNPPGQAWEKDNSIDYSSGDKKELRIMKAMVYSLKFEE